MLLVLLSTVIGTATSLPEMHLETYMKLIWEHHEAEMEHLTGMRERLDNMWERLEDVMNLRERAASPQ